MLHSLCKPKIKPLICLLPAPRPPLLPAAVHSPTLQILRTQCLLSWSPPPCSPYHVVPAGVSSCGLCSLLTVPYTPQTLQFRSLDTVSFSPACLVVLGLCILLCEGSLTQFECVAPSSLGHSAARCLLFPCSFWSSASCLAQLLSDRSISCLCYRYAVQGAALV